MTPGPRNAVALLVGIGYADRPGINPLRFAARDARALARLVADPRVCAFPPDRVALLTDAGATRAGIVRHLSRWLPEAAAGADLVLFYFAGHGVVGRIGGHEEGYLLPSDAGPDDVATHGIAMTDVARWLDGLAAPNVCICLDCCHAGSILPGEGVSLRADLRDMQLQPSLLQRLGGRGRFLLVSCDRGQKSIEADELRHGLFTYHLLRGLRRDGDRDGDGRVSVAELFSYVSAAVSRDAREKFGREQTPWTSAVYTEDVILSTVRPRRPSDAAAATPTPLDTPAQPLSGPPSPLAGAGEAGSVGDRLRQLRRRPDPAELPFIFRHLAHDDDATRRRAQQALRALDWDGVLRAGEALAREGDADKLEAVFTGLTALEAHEQVVRLLDRLAGLLRGAHRDRAVWLLDRKRLALERDRVAQALRDKNCPYEITRVLGPGLYTGAYLARAEMTGLEVVVRVLRAEYATQPLVRGHFLELAGKAVRLVHHNLVLTREVRAFPDRDLYFTVRDYVPGATLREVLESGRRFEPLQACKLLRQVLDALTPLWREGVPHGGLKPSNLFLTRDDRVLLGEPSLSLPPGGWDRPRLAYDFRYCAPERFRGDGELTPAADLYGLGCVAHELFRGRPPFVADSHFELIARHERDPVPTLRSSLAECALDDWLQALLAKHPSGRFPGLAEALAGLDAVERAHRPAPPPRAAARAEGTTAVWGPDAPDPALPASPPSVHLLHDQSLADLADRQSIVPLHTLGGGPGTYGPETGLSLAIAAGAPPSPPGLEVLEKLGEGGMGTVYKARQVRLDRIVALKMIRSLHLAHGDARQRFHREAKAVAALHHPNIVQIYDMGEIEGQPYLVMEFCGGRSLSAELQLRQVGPREAAALIEVLARAVQHAHERGIIHRDLKPSNVLLTEDGRPRITDFGLAKQVHTDDPLQTGSGQIVGTPAYMPPEQAQGRLKDIGPATDVWGLGAMLYQLLTGRPPFAAPSTMEVLVAVLQSDPPPPSSLAPAVPRELDRVVHRCLRKAPAERYPSAEALADDLRRFLDGAPAAALPRGKGRWWWPFTSR